MATTESLPAPLIPAEVDLGGYEWMPLYGDKLLNSETWVLASAEAKVAALTLWWQSYAHQRPAGSLPNNDRLLADAAGYGVAVAAWKAIKEEALRGWVPCSDGRLYHPVVAKLAMQAWETRRADIAKKEAERARKKARRSGGNSTDNPPPSGGCPPENDDVSAGQNDDVHRTEDQRPPDNPPLSDRASAGIPAENALKGKERTGQERSTGTVRSSAGGPRARPAAEARPPADVGNLGISAIREAVRLGFEERFDLPDRPIPPAEEELFAAWVEAGQQRGLSPEEAGAAVAEEVRRQFRRLDEAGGGPPRSLRAVLDADVRTAIANARPHSRGSLPAPPPVPEPYAGHFEPHEFAAWIAPCRITAAGRVAKVEAPSRQVRDWIAQRLEPKLRVSLGVDTVEVMVVQPRSADIVPLKVGG